MAKNTLHNIPGKVFFFGSGWGHPADVWLMKQDSWVVQTAMQDLRLLSGSGLKKTIPDLSSNVSYSTWSVWNEKRVGF